jgi:hypothetical protein
MEYGRFLPFNEEAFAFSFAFVGFLEHLHVKRATKEGMM